MIPYDSIRNIAIFRRNGLGDVLCSIPLALRCKEMMPKAKVHLFIEQGVSCLIPYLQGPDKIIPIPPNKNKYFEIAHLAWNYRKTSFDLALSAKTTPMKLMNGSLFAIGAKYRAAYVDQSWHSKLVNRPRPFSQQKTVHQALRSIHLIDPEMETLPPRLYPTLKPPTKKKLFPQKTLLLSVSNNRVGSTLPIDRTAAILNTLATKHSFAVAVSGMPKDLSKAWELASLLSMQKGIFSTESFDDFMSLLYSADAIFVGDGGIAHLSAGFQKPSVLLFGGTKVWEWGPLSEKAIVLSTPHHVADIPQAEILNALETIL
ncbi:MAG: glycosyltransferase family 9 protein [Verrucomicrobia bacterium]|nr:glycosyltransferase family 9 protein [Verrucomicrobiota bacterium]